MLFLVLLSIVTPWLMNQDSSITLLAVPFVWLAYAAAFVKFIPLISRRPSETPVSDSDPRADDVPRGRLR
ncbi:hypothetical protein [Burkholderia pseudomallei]|uniref:hypothetical protein n=1 Tax=Burkholderia pseudomallei TaxID=28450 RepID=UPI000A851E0E|nr:hypothetical protein [Burkholderia pseudomallei]